MNYTEFCKQLNVRPLLSFSRPGVYVVYLLMDKDLEIVYIGKSDTSNYVGRIRSHHKTKEFQYHAVIETYLTEQEALATESALISLIRPQYNSKDAYPDAAKVFHGLSLFHQRISLNGIPAPVYDPKPDEYTEEEAAADSSDSSASIEEFESTVRRVRIRFLVANAVLLVGLAGMTALSFRAAYYINVAVFGEFREDMVPVITVGGFLTVLPVALILIWVQITKALVNTWRALRSKEQVAQPVETATS